jgi:MoaA/NifB/PqqE/SkfB family radical SAM enzyme
MATPNSKNFCGGNFQDWLEVNLIEKCNARCSWCIEKSGFHPSFHASTEVIANAAIKTGKTNIILLGGEPLLFQDIKNLIQLLLSNDKKVWITTNGFLLSDNFVLDKLIGVWGVNISIHHFDLSENKEITGVLLQQKKLEKAISALHNSGAHVRMNCNAISGKIDSKEKILKYVEWAKNIGADKVRFAELKQDNDGFVDLAKIMKYEHGLNDNPFIFGCNSDCVIGGIPVNFRQMCGLQTSRRISPSNPEQYAKEVLYYDGKIYQGWQTISQEKKMNENEKEVLKKVTSNKLTDAEIEALLKLIERLAEREVSRQTPSSSGGCQY